MTQDTSREDKDAARVGHPYSIYPKGMLYGWNPQTFVLSLKRARKHKGPASLPDLRWIADCFDQIRMGMRT